MNTSYQKAKLGSVLAALLVTLNLATAGPLKEGDPFPDLSGFGLEGKLPDVKGKVVLVDFFASWCDPCKASFPAMEELQKKYAAKGLVIIAINVDKRKADMDAFLKENPVSFTVVRDATNKLVSAVKIPTMPSSFLLDRSGKVHHAHHGFKGKDTSTAYASEIEALLK